MKSPSEIIAKSDPKKLLLGGVFFAVVDFVALKILGMDQSNARILFGAIVTAILWLIFMTMFTNAFDKQK